MLDRLALDVEMNCMKQAIALLCFASCILGAAVSFLDAEQAKSPDKSKDESQFVKPGSIQGCYELALSEWRPNLKIAEDRIFITPPHRIQVFAERGTKGWEEEGYIVKPAPGDPGSIHRGSYWLPKGPKSIEIVYTTGFSGLSMLLNIDGELLRGKASTFWDFTRKRQTADVVARKVDCEKK
jgi:hypothetical protein